ncbi:MAG: 4-(cytidine 5'-diphospho)-2-C-methyl-D-erythritol kinase [Dehalococcoidia bacterium]|nr:4-(cytidine 5'-diphospho)-2-C-methyl-D-erythritol kinase [Dehalococcoidia bacterium]
MLTVYAPAKVNLVLEVLGECADYHELSSVVQAIGLYDVLNFELADELSFECSEASLESHNLVVEAATLLREATGHREGARIELRKHIPWGMGLGGGSSDAASTLKALSKLWKLELPTLDLLSLAFRLGSDVPFFIYGGTGLIEGRGERVTPLAPLTPTCFVLLLPSVPVMPGKTKQLYGKLKAGDYTEGQFVRAALLSLRRSGTVLPSLMWNAFERVAYDLFPELDELRSSLEKAGASSVCLAGSGPCLFTPVAEEGRAREICLRLEGQGLQCYLTRSVATQQ